MGSDRLPAGPQPYDGINGMRIGALAGGLLGALLAAVADMPWLIATGAVVGGGIGFWYERHGMDGAREDQSPGPNEPT